MCGVDMINFYQNNLNMSKIYPSFSISDIEELYPFERDIYLTLIEKELQQAQEGKNG